MSYLSPPSSSTIITSPCTIYITLQWLRNVNGQNKYHWGLFLSDSSPPRGHLIHATDMGNKPLDLYMEVRKVSNPAKSRTMVTCLQISAMSSKEVMIHCAQSVPLMDRKHIPFGEKLWTCRVWAKEVLKVLHENRYIQIPMSVDSIERCCQATADAYIDRMGQARIFNDRSWLSSPRPPVSSRSASGYYGPSPMMIDSTGAQMDYQYGTAQPSRQASAYYGPKPMITETSRYSGYR